MTRAVLFIIPIILITLSPASAKEVLRFNNPQNHKENKAIEFISKNQQEASSVYEIAKIDLNDDLIDEYVIKPKGRDKCTQANLCTYTLVALQDYSPIKIGEFNAHKLLILDKKTYGIRDIIVYNDSYNDFKNITARWNPFTFSYQGY